MRRWKVQWSGLPQKRHFTVTARHGSIPLPFVHIDNATFYHQYPSSTADASSSPANPPLFPKLSFTLPANGSSSAPNQYWSILSSSSLARTTFLQVLNGQFISIPATARSYPFLASPAISDARLHSPSNAIKYVGFDAERSGLGGTSLRGAYLSARYEARKEETDFDLHDYLTGHTELNALERTDTDVDLALLDKVVKDLRLGPLLDMPVGNLSNGQTRRARIAKSLMSRPELLLLDGPFMGLDPPTVGMLSAVLQSLAEKSAPRLVLSLRPEDHIPEWITHLVLVDESLRVLGQGPREEVLQLAANPNAASGPNTGPAAAAAIRGPGKNRDKFAGKTEILSRDGFPRYSPALASGEAIVEMESVKVAYGSKIVLGDWTQPGASKAGLQWSVQRGQRWGIFGPNGSGKTTLLSLITSDHPQTYSLPVKLFGRSRLPATGERGISLFELQRRIGHSSPEVHSYFPKHLTVRRVLESASSDAPMSRPELDEQAKLRVSACLRWFAAELNPSPPRTTTLQHFTTEVARATSRSDLRTIDSLVTDYKTLCESDGDLAWTRTARFSDLAFSAQRLALFLRAVVAGQELVILDEALSGMDEATRDKALLFLVHGEALTAAAAAPGNAFATSVLAEHGLCVMQGLSERQALLVISHSKQDVPGCVRQWVCLPEPGEGRAPRWGSLDGPLELNTEGWDEIWGMREHGEVNV